MNEQQFLAWEQNSRDTIDFKKIYVDVTGDIVTGLLLSQIVYWFLPNKDGKTKLRVEYNDKLWVAKGRTDWFDECRISAKQFDRSIKILEDIGIVETILKKFNSVPTKHIWLNIEVLIQKINEINNGVKSNLPKGENGNSPKGKMDFPQRVKSNLPKGESGNSLKGKMDFTEKVISLTENTTEITTENTDRHTGNKSVSPSDSFDSIKQDLEEQLNIDKLKNAYNDDSELIDEIFDNIMEMYYLDGITVDKSVMPKQIVRSRIAKLTDIHLVKVLEDYKSYNDPIINHGNFIKSMLFKKAGEFNLNNKNGANILQGLIANG